MKIIGITACPTGIAHTYMSAEKLEVTARSLGYEAKFETQGAKTENVLTSSDIEEADAIILAVDKDVDTSRFAGRNIKRVSTARAIKEPEKVIEEALENIGTTKISLDKKKNSQEQKSGIYNHFMNGVNYMLPFVIAGGIIIALSFAFGITASDPKSDDYNVLAGALSTIGGGTAFAMMVPAVRSRDCQFNCRKSWIRTGNRGWITGGKWWIRFLRRDDRRFISWVYDGSFSK